MDETRDRAPAEAGRNPAEETPQPSRAEPQARAGGSQALSAPSAEGQTAPAQPQGANDLKEKVIEAVSTVFDPEIPVNIYELGLIYSLDVDPGGAVSIRMTLTSPACPSAEFIPPEVERKVASIPGVTGVRLELVWDPPWNPSMMSEAARMQLNLF